MTHSSAHDLETLNVTACDEPVCVAAPPKRASAYIFASPHSGRIYADRFVRGCLPPLNILRRSEDAYVDALFADAPSLGAPLICATFPRVFVDPNRARDELDPDMFEERACVPGAQVTARAGAGLGVIPRLAADGRALYAGRVSQAELHHRLTQFYDPYHARLRAEVEAVRATFGAAYVIDCHSMPAASARGADIVLGDRYGASCSRGLVARAEAHFRDLGFAVVRNRPYAGGYTTEHYGRPETGVEALQIEINRGLYLHEADVRPASGLQPLRRALADWMDRMLQDERPQRIAAE
ncbi:MAG: N-formylglutamate amidohydrolase [Alphaproteobacteria bacterium]|nr:N-formylglutamate amidohydrolase [Alphaproteobacteria bacterium]